MEASGKEESRLRAACLLYHDVIENGDWNSSGFTGPGTAKYKLRRAEFVAHLIAITEVRNLPSITAGELANTTEAFPFLLTFDDGGESATTCIADLLDKHEWRGHFFVIAGQIGKRSFLNGVQIRSLRNRVHVIGSHSFSHPQRMSYCSQERGGGSSRTL